MPDVSSDIVPLGRREANKRDKLARIRCAAKEVFLMKGFEAATVREIAAAADVAFGTIFLYAKDKQDLLFLVFEDDLNEVSERAFSKVDGDTPFVDQLIAYFAEFYVLFLKTPQLSRDMIREINFHTGLVATRLWAGVQSQERHIAELVSQGQAQGWVNAAVDAHVAAHIIFSLHRTQLHFCLEEEQPKVQANLRRLRRQFETVFPAKEKRADPSHRGNAARRRGVAKRSLRGVRSA